MAMSLRVTCVAVVVALLGVSLVAAQFPDFEESTSEDLELVLPAFPLPPKRDRVLLGMHATEALGVGNGERSEFEADDTPRFRATAVSDAEDEDEQAEAEEDAESEEDSSAEVSGDEEAALVEAHAGAAVHDAEADTTEEILEETMEDDSEDAQPTVMVAAAATANPQAMRFASAMQRRYDDLTLPSGLPPALPSQNYAEIARLPVSAVGDALFTPIHPTEPQFPGAFSTPSLAGGRNNYAFAEHKRYPNYAYGNANWGAPVNAQFYPNPNPPAPAPAPAAAPKEEAKAEAEAEATSEESAGGEEAEAAESSFMEVAEQQRLYQRERNFQAQQQAMAQAMQQRMRQSAAAGVVYPYAPHLAPRNTPARNPAADLMHAEYQTYSRANWPSSVAPPPAYYLPPDVVAI